MRKARGIYGDERSVGSLFCPVFKSGKGRKSKASSRYAHDRALVSTSELAPENPASLMKFAEFMQEVLV